MFKAFPLSFALTLGAEVALAQATPPGARPSAPAEARAAAVGEIDGDPDASNETAPPPTAVPGKTAGPATERAESNSETDAVFADLEQELTPGAPPAVGAAARPESAASKPARGSASMNPDLSLVLDFAAAGFSTREHRQTGGHDPTRNGFNLQSLELSAKSVVDPYFRFDANLVFAEDGVEIEEVYGTTTDLPGGLQARFGQFLTRFGRINPTHPHAWDFVDQPFAIGRAFGAEGNRGPGVELSWLLPLPWYVELVASATHATGAGTARSFYAASDPGVDGPKDLLYVTALKQFFDLSSNWSLLVGTSGAFGPNNTGRDARTAIYATDLYLKYRPITRQSSTVVSLQTEVLYRRRQIPSLVWDVSGYSQAFVRFARRWGAALRYELGTPAYASDGAITIDPIDPDWTRTRHRVSANVSHWPSEFSRLRLQGSRDTASDGKGIWAAFLAAELVVGAHGAHAF